MRIHRSNHPEKLVERLGELIAAAPPAPFAVEPIVVQGKGMERWLSMQLAERLGIWAHPHFPFPQRLLEQAFDAVLGREPSTALYAAEHLTWAVARILHDPPAGPAFAPLTAYLDSAGEQRSERCLALAERIAWVLDRYVTHRPQLIEGWGRGEDAEDWQAQIWRQLTATYGPHHLAARARAFVDRIAAGSGPLPDFPGRLFLFGTSSLPPLYLRVLAALAERVEVHLFLLSPSREYWAEIRSRREILRELSRSDPAQLAEELHLAQGHPLLASLGTLGRDFLQLVEGLLAYEESEDDLFVDPAGEDPTLLQRLQSDILHLNSPSPGERDASIAVHACHGPVREIEVLRDQLLALFEADPTLEPRDVVIMTPEVETYAPFVQAIFDADPIDGGRIPCRVADRRARAVDGVLDVFGRLLALLPKRFAAPEVLELLAAAAVRERFAIGEAELDTLHQWIDEAGIRWGADAHHREEVGLPATANNSWRFGLDRLLLGFAMPGAGRELFGGVLPCDAVAGGQGSLLGRLAELCATLFELRTRLAAPRPLPAWRDDLSEALARVVAVSDETAHQHQAIRDALGELAAEAERAGFTEPVSLAAVASQLEGRCERRRPAREFLSGGVTFCDLVPMRNIPFRVVCLVGMNDDSFPRRDPPLSFDRLSGERRLGDRSRRDDDRYSFLEALLAARQHLIITYVGQGIVDNAERPPSVVVSDLLDALAAATGATDDEVGAELVVRHPLQAMSSAYFGAGVDPALFSFSASLCAATTRRSGADLRAPPPRFCGAPVAPGEERAAISLDELARYFGSPVGAFCTGRLGIWFEEAAAAIDPREPVDLDHLDQYRVGSLLLEQQLAGVTAAAAWPALAASGLLPHGNAGRIAFYSLWRQVEGVAAAVEARLGDPPLAPLALDLPIGEQRLIGGLRLWPTGQVVHGFRRLRADRELDLWIRHLALCLAHERGEAPGYPQMSHAIGRAADGDGSDSFSFLPVDEPEPLLAELLEIFTVGQRLPLPFFPDAARAFAAAEDEASGLVAARKRFLPTNRQPYLDGGKPHVRLVFGEDDPLAPAFGVGVSEASAAGIAHAEAFSFVALAARIFAPLLAHREAAP